MFIVDIINKKRCGGSLSKEEINYAVNGYVSGEVKDYQMSSLLMAICLNGMSTEEIIYLTDAMLYSGKQIDLSSIRGVKVDKHSTGGVGDKTTLVIAPIVSACGVPVVKMSGRALGHTGGTIDKLESILGYNVNMDIDDIIKQVNEIGVCIGTSTCDLAPADKKIYALRDVTGTVSSLALIASSIMSKKLATGSDKILLDVKYGRGALIPDLKDAIELAKLMVYIGNSHKKETMAVVTCMDHPLGRMIGNGLEVKEAIDILNGRGDKELRDLCVVLASYMVSMSLDISFKDAQVKVVNVINNKNAYNKFLELVKKQGGNIDLISISPNYIEIKSRESGYINDIDALKLANISLSLGAGRVCKEDVIDYGVGVEIISNIGSFVNKGDTLCKLYLGSKQINYDKVYDAYVIEKDLKEKKSIIYGCVK